MNVNIHRRNLQDRPNAVFLFDLFQESIDKFRNSEIFFEFPVYKDFDGKVISVPVLVISPNCGVIVFAIIETISNHKEIIDNLDQVVNFIHSRLLRNRKLRSSKFTLSIPINYACFSSQEVTIEDTDGLLNENDFLKMLGES